MSSRRLCAVDDELCERVPKRAPKSLCPRLRSSKAPFLRRSARLSATADSSILLGAFCNVDSGWLESVLRRGRLASVLIVEDCLRFN